MFNSGFRGKRASDNTGTIASQSQFIQQQYPQPSISGYSIVGTDDTALNPAGGQTVLVNGTGFASGAAVTVNGQTISPVTVISSTQLSFTSIALAGGSYSLIVYNSTGGAAILVPGLIYSAVPTWTTAAGSIGNLYETTAINTSVVATSDSAITYSLSSGSLPSGATLYANGVITGTSPIESGSSTYTFAIKAEDAELQDTTRTFTLTINTDVVTWSAPADGTTYTVYQNEVAANVTLSATSAAGYNVSYSANTLPTGLALTGNTISGTPTVVANTTTLLTATASTTNRGATRTINWVVQLGNDPYFNYTTLLLNGETSSSYWIQDASTNRFALTINGDAKPVAFSPYKTQYSAYLDGIDDYVGFPNGTAVQLSTGSFTIECFVYRDSSGPAYPVIWTNTPGDGGAGGEFTHYMIHPAGDNLMYAGGTYISGGTRPTANKWCHYVLCRDGTSTRCYVDGVRQWEATSGSIFTATYGLASGTFTIGVRTANVGQTSTKGYISNFRVTKGACLYTGASFTVPTSTLSVGANTSVLTLQSNRYLDNSTSALTITGYNGTLISNFSPFVETDITTGSGYFDGTGDYITCSSSSSLNLSADFTLEFWVYPTASYANGAIAGTTSSSIRFDSGGYFYFLNTGSQYIAAQPASFLTLNVWTHVAISRVGTSLKIFRNGIEITISENIGNANTATYTFSGINIGYSPNSFGGTFTGCISNFRIVNGTGLYTTNFTPPIAPLTAIANTSLLTLQYRIGENNNRFVDTSGLNNLITRNGNTTQGTFTPFSQTGWSLSFNGSNDNVVLSSTTQLNIESVDFTIEAWIFMNVMPTGTSTTGWSGDWSQWFIIYERSAGGASGWQFRVGATLLTLGGDGDNSIAWGTHGMTSNTWYHVAVSRATSTYRIFVNGTSLSLTTQAVSMGTSGSYYIGSEDTSGANFNGYISNLRVIKNQAIYTGAFTPSTTPLTSATLGSTGAGVAASLTGSVVLLTCNSNSVVDNSGGTNTISRTGTNTKVLAFSPFAPAIITPTTYSVNFPSNNDGSSNLQIAHNSALSFTAANDWTLEAYVNLTANNTYNYFISKGNQSTREWAISVGPTNFIFYWSTNGGGSGDSSITAGYTFNFCQWYHIAVSKSGSSVRLFVNGTQIGSTGTFTTIFNGTDPLWVGTFCAYTGIAHNYGGTVSNIRILKGTALYTTNFTPPTAPLTAIANTVLLICQSSTLIDNSTNNFSITQAGSVKLTSVNPTGNTLATGNNASYGLTTVGGSMYFDGTGDYLASASAPVSNFETNNFTFEAWVYFTAMASAPYYQVFASSASTGGFQVYKDTNTTTLVWGIINTSQNNIVTGLVPFVWYHIAVSRSGSTLRTFANGVLTNSYSNSTNFTITGAYVGAYANGASNFPGYITDLRINKGTALYTSAFVPPIAPLTPIAGTTLLLNGTNSGVIDYTSKNPLESVGDAKVSNAVVKYSSGSMLFTPGGSSNYLKMPLTPNLQFAAGENFTIECWVYLITNAAGICALWSNYDSFSAGTLSLFAGHASSSNNLFIIAHNGTFPALSSSTTVNSRIGLWTHIAVVRNSNSIRLYINGTSEGTPISSTVALPGVGSTFWVASTGDSTTANPNVYIDDFRITKGIARYTANFTPPTQAFITF